jgi:YD repeat-containing protein
MTVTGWTLVALLAMTLLVQAQPRTFYDSAGRQVGRSTTSGNTTQVYDAAGRVVARERTSGRETTVYGSAGRQIGRYTTRK